MKGTREAPSTGSFDDERSRPAALRGPGGLARRLKWQLWLLLAPVALLAIVAPHTWFVRSLTVGSASMESTLHCSNAPACLSTRASRVIASSIPYLVASPRRGDIVVIDFEHEAHTCSGTRIVKRLVGLPGEVVGQVAGTVLVDGRRLAEPYLPARIRRGPGFPRRRLPPGTYFVMGDNRTRSCDSRAFGPVPRRLIKAKVIATY